MASLEKALLKLIESSVTVSESGDYPESGQASVLITFADGTKVQASYWRIIKNGKHLLSSFDHQQIYGLPVRIDAKEELRKELQEKRVVEAHLDTETGDLIFIFTCDLKLTVFNFSGYEIWQIHFPNGAVDYSNYYR